VTDRFDYDPYGGLITRTGSTDTPSIPTDPEVRGKHRVSEELGDRQEILPIYLSSVSAGIRSSCSRICWSEGATPFAPNRSKVLREATVC
jgi:hypothetical protein